MKHSEKQPEKNKLNKSSIALLSLVGLVMLFVFLNRYELVNINELMSSRNDSYLETTNATVYSYENKNIAEQTKWGNASRTVGYVVKYRYKVKGHLYDKEEVLNTWVKPSFLIFLNQHLNQDVFTVRYDIINPENASLIQRIKE